MNIREVRHSSCPILNCFTFPTVDILFSIAREPKCWPNPSYFLITSDLFPCLLWLNFGYCIICQLCWFMNKSVTVCVLHNFPNVLADWISSWLYLHFHWLSFCGGFSRCIFSLAKEKKTQGKKPAKNVPLNSIKKYPSR